LKELRRELFYLDIGPQVNTNGYKLLLAAAVLVFYTRMSQLFQYNARRLRLANLSFTAAASYPGILKISGAYTIPQCDRQTDGLTDEQMIYDARSITCCRHNYNFFNLFADRLKNWDLHYVCKDRPIEDAAYSLQALINNRMHAKLAILS